jgi:hypothetical protein
MESQKADRNAQQDHACDSQVPQNDGARPHHDVAPLPSGCELYSRSLTLSADVFPIPVLVAVFAFNGGTTSGTNFKHSCGYIEWVAGF